MARPGGNRCGFRIPDFRSETGRGSADWNLLRALGESKVTGSVKGDQVEIAFQVSPSGDAVKVVYSGKLLSDKKLKGTVKLGDLGSGTFTAEKK